MPGTKYDVVAIGNAIVDIIGRCEDSFLDKHAAPKGHMRLVDTATIDTIYADMGPGVEISGGSAANTAAGIASLGGRGAFIGKVSDDEFGRIFRHDIRAAGVAFETPAAENSALATSRSLILVTPDGQRTMNTYLGISTDFTQSDVDPAVIEASRIVYLEGYLFDREEAKGAFREALAIAKKAGRQVALTLSDSFCVDRHRAEFLALIRAGIDIVFANENEILSLYETTSFDEAVRHVSRDTRLAVLTRSELGSLVVSEGTPIQIAPDPVAKVVDTTGAGDLYAAGFLFGLARSDDFSAAGRFGSFAAAEIIGQMGARPEIKLSHLARMRGLLG
ncbi:adenosine kinase [Hyphomicrobium sp.]|uniref:adenosine kinase n=1 Tax=Hyphomicrobium sp. TaxID=82 RepID=UPI002D15A811|nr:adenosine kinase [Hyphomicrobium sp.]HRN88980.1 adenosine kinase [Hyphomicrobium sp.]HRQ28120.1 adenosine kinase [Hyphomicrobium sp.]